MAGPNLLSTLALFGGGEPAPDPLPSLDLPNVADQPMGLSPGLPAPMPAAPTAPRRGGLDMVRDLAPIIMAVVAGRKNPLHGAAIANGMATGALAAQREQMAAQQHDEELRRLGSEFMRQTAADVMRLKDPLERQQYLDFAEQIGVQQFKLPPQWTRRVPAHHAGDDLFAKLRGELAEKLKAFDSDKKWTTVAGTPQEAKISFRLSNGQSVPVSKARQLIGQAVYDASGNQAFAPMPDTSEPPENKTDYSRFLTRYAKQLGKASANELTAAEELAAKKAYGQADDRPADPTLQAIRELTLATARQNQGSRTYSPAQERAVNMLADDYARDSKDFITRAQSFDTVKSAAKDSTAAGDISLIFAYMKMLDPGSVVREGEFATAQNATGVPDRVRNLYNQIISGNRLNPTQRADFLNQAKNLYATSKTRHDRITQSYTDRARRRGLNPDDVVLDYGSADEPAATPAAPPKPKGPNVKWSKSLGAWVEVTGTTPDGKPIVKVVR